MTRLYDRLVRKGGSAFPRAIDKEGEFAQRLVSNTFAALDDATVVDFTNVARHFLTVEEREEWDCRDDFPRVTLPLSPGFYEFQSPGYSYSNQTGVVDYRIHATGYLAQMNAYDEAQVERVGAGFWNVHEPEWLVETLLILEFEKGNPRVAAVHYWPLDSEGRMIKEADEVLMATIPLAAIGLEEEQQRRFQLELSPSKYPYLFGLSMMNCKNTHLTPVNPRPKVARRYERKHGIPLTSYYTLEVEPMRSVSSASSSSGKKGERRALHITRGHFKTYSAEKPLFGKLSGTYWWEQSVRGSKKHGEVIKDYSVKAPGAEVRTEQA